MKSLLARFPYIPRERILALQRYASTLQAPKVHSRRRKPRRRIVAFHPYDLDFLTDDVKLKGNVRIYRHANGRWYVRFKLNGKRFFLSTGERDQTKALLKTSELIKNSERKGKPKTADKAVETFAQLAEVYARYSKANKGSYTVLKERSKMRSLLRAFGQRRLDEITSHDIERYMETRREKVQPATVNHDLALLKHMFHKAVDWEYVDDSPARKVKLLKEPPGRIRYLKRAPA